VCALLNTQPAGHLDSWLGRRIQAMQPAGGAGAGSATVSGGEAS
jgi:hypothetical protein